MSPDRPRPTHQRLRQAQGLLLALRARAKLLQAIRGFFASRDFLEVTTPALALAPDPAVHLDSFRCELDLPGSDRRPVYLLTSPEYPMKRLLAAGLPRIFQVCPFFRNGEITALHNPEFTGLEWYATGIDFASFLEQTEVMVRTLATEVLGTTVLNRAGPGVDLSNPFVRLTVRQALNLHAGVAVPPDWNEPDLRRALERAGIHTAAADRFDDLVNRALIERVEPALQKQGPVFLTEYPAPMAALARLKPGDPSVSERFELYAGGLELCNGYGELTDAVEQRARFQAQLEERRVLGRDPVPLDEAFLEALAHGLPASCGCALGVDRLLMLFLGAQRIEEVLAFPMAAELGLTDR